MGALIEQAAKRIF